MKRARSILLLCAAASISSQAQTFTVLTSFNGTNGAVPQSFGPSLVQGADGNLYGTTAHGGANSDGTVFKLTPSGTLTTLYSFCSQIPCADGASDISGLVRSADGNFYGTTQFGGIVDAGTVFKITPGGALTTIYNFGSTSPNAQNTRNGLIQASDGNFYGTGDGGTKSHGAVYKLTPGGVETLLYSFDGTDGDFPEGALVQGTDGNFYGTTAAGGSSGLGNVFKMTPAGNLTTLYAFSGTDGQHPRGALIQATDGNFYGITVSGGDSFFGTVFRISPEGTLTTLYSFQGADDHGEPSSGLLQASDGNLYGTTTLGGGTIFRITLDGTLTTLHTFDQDSDGVNPFGALIQASNGILYGTTAAYGPNGSGTVFSLQFCTPPQPFTTLTSFNGTNGSNAASTGSSLVQGADGNFYGTTQFGGANGQGNVFQVTPAGVLTSLYDFGSTSTDGNVPIGGLARGSDGNFYGTTSTAGANGQGTVFQITPAGALTTLFSFGASPSDGVHPSSLIQGTDGNFYGTTPQGANGLGTVFQLTPAGVLTTLYTFTGASDGAAPSGPLFQAPDGNFYGTTPFGSSPGTIFKLTPDGTLSTLYTFSGPDGAGPLGSLIQATDGNFYGITIAGGVNNFGTVFQLTPDGTLTTLHRFCAQPPCSDGDAPKSGLIQASDGNLYGTTSRDGAHGAGTIFQITLGGTLTTLYNFLGPDGAVPWGSLVQAGNGILYGTTSGGGDFFNGTVFSIGLPSACANARPL